MLRSHISAPRFLLRTLGVVEEAHAASCRMITPRDDEGIKAIAKTFGRVLAIPQGVADVIRMQGPDDPDRVLALMRQLEDRLDMAAEDRLVPPGHENRIAWVVSLDEP